MKSLYIMDSIRILWLWLSLDFQLQIFQHLLIKSKSKLNWNKTVALI